MTVTRRSTGEYTLSFVVRVTDPPAPGAGAACGVDLGLSAFATVLTEHRDGTEEIGTFPSPRYLRRKERALARSQRNMSRKKKGSANRAKARIKVAGLHRRVANARLDHAHKVAHDLVALHSTIVIEDLNVTGIAKGRLAKSTHDAGLGQFRRVLAEKCERNGRALIAVDRFFPSTRMCSSCQQLTGPTGLAELKVRVWDCSVCGASHDRDVNAARNLLAEGVRLLSQ